MSRRASPRLLPASEPSDEAAHTTPHATRPAHTDLLPHASVERSRRTHAPSARLTDSAFVSGAAASRPLSAASAAAAAVTPSAGVAAASAKQSSPRMSMAGSGRGKNMVRAATKNKQPNATPATPLSPNNGTMALQSQMQQQQHSASEPQLLSPSRATASPRRTSLARNLLVVGAGKAARSAGLDARSVFPASFQEAVSGAAAPPIHSSFPLPGAPQSPLRAPAAAAVGSPSRLLITAPLAQAAARLRNQHTPAHQPTDSSDHPPSLLTNLHGHSFAAPAVVEPTVIAPPPSLAQAAAAMVASLQPQHQRPVPTLPGQVADAAFPFHATRHSVTTNDTQPATRAHPSSPPPPPPQPQQPLSAAARARPTAAAVPSTRSVARHVHGAASLPIPVLPKPATPPKPAPVPPKRVSLKDQLALAQSPDPSSLPSAAAAAASTNSLSVPGHGRPTRTLTQTGNDIDNPISLDDDEESQQHRLHSQNAGSAASSSALFPSLDLDPQSQQRAQLRVESKEWASVDCLTLVEASGGGAWQWPSDRGLFPNNMASKLTFEPTQIKIEWVESEDALAPSQRLSEGSHYQHSSSGSSGGGSGAMMRSGSNVVPPSPGAHSSSSHAAAADATSESVSPPEYLHGATLLIPLRTIRSLDLHRYRPYTLLLYLHDGELGVHRPVKIDCVDDRAEDLTGTASAAAPASPPPDCPAKQLRIEFDSGSALDDPTIHVIMLTNPAYKSITRVFKDRKDAESAAPPPSVRPLMNPEPPRHAAASSAASGSGAPYLVYPAVGKDQVSLHSSDLLCLRSGEFLNDSIVDFYLKHIWHSLLSPEVRASVHFFNSFFYKKWCIVEEKVINSTALGVASKKRGGAAASAAASSIPASSPPATSAAAPVMSAEYAAVSKWAKSVDVFSKDFLVVPVNESLHWSLAIICYPRKFFQRPATNNVATAAAAAAAGTNNAQKRKLHLSNGTSAAADLNADHALPSSKKPRASSDDHKSAVRFDATSMIDDDDDVLVCERPPEGSSTSASPAVPASAAAAAAAASLDPPSTLDPLCVPAVLYLDSLLPVPEQLYRRLSQYLQEEWTARYPAPHPRSLEVWSPPPYIGGLAGKPPKGSVASHAASSLSPFGARESKVHYLADDPLYEMDVPEQKNGCDCGLFLLEYTEQFFSSGGGAKNKITMGYNAASTAAGGPQVLRSFMQKLRESEAAAAVAPPSKASVTRNKMNAPTGKFESALKLAWKKPAIRGYGGYGGGGSEDWVRGKRESIRKLIEEERLKLRDQTEAQQQKSSYVMQLLKQQQQQPQAPRRPVINITHDLSPIVAQPQPPPPPPVVANDSPSPFVTAAAAAAAPSAVASDSPMADSPVPSSPVAAMIPLLRPPPPVCTSLSPPLEPPSEPAYSQMHSQAHSIDSHMAPVDDPTADASDERKSASPSQSAAAEDPPSMPMSLEDAPHMHSDSSLSLFPGELELE